MSTNVKNRILLEGNNILFNWNSKLLFSVIKIYANVHLLVLIQSGILCISCLKMSIPTERWYMGHLACCRGLTPTVCSVLSSVQPWACPMLPWGTATLCPCNSEVAKGICGPGHVPIWIVLMDKEIWISYNIHVSQNILLLIFSNSLKS